jgi:hypothetical protein
MVEGQVKELRRVCQAVARLPNSTGLEFVGAFDYTVLQVGEALKNSEGLYEYVRALEELREAAGMYCERLPVEVREALHRIPEIEKTHPHATN